MSATNHVPVIDQGGVLFLSLSPSFQSFLGMHDVSANISVSSEVRHLLNWIKTVGIYQL